MDVITKIAGIVIITAICALFLRKYSPELSLLLVIVASIVVFYVSSTAMQSTIKLVQEIAVGSGVNSEHLAVILKVLGITIITKIAADICKDAGSESLAGITTLSGNLLAIITAVPLIASMLKFVSSI